MRPPSRGRVKSRKISRASSRSRTIGYDTCDGNVDDQERRHARRSIAERPDAARRCERDGSVSAIDSREALATNSARSARSTSEASCTSFIIRDGNR